MSDFVEQLTQAVTNIKVPALIDVLREMRKHDESFASYKALLEKAFQDSLSSRADDGLLLILRRRFGNRDIIASLLLTALCEPSAFEEQIEKYQKNNINKKPEKTNGVKFLNAIVRNNISTVSSLLETGVDVDAYGEKRCTALMIASSYGYEEIVRLLIDKGATVNAQDDDGNTALMVAARDGNASIAQMLLEAGADINAVNRKGDNAMTLAATYGHGKLFLFFRKNMDYQWDYLTL